MQGCLKRRTPSDAESFIYMGDDNKVRVEEIRVYRLKLESSFYLDLDETVYVLSFRQNLISVSCLDKSGYTCSFGNGSF